MGKEEFTNEQLLEKLRQTESTLRDYEEITKIMSDQPILGILIAQGVPPRFAYMNQALAKIIGYPMDKLMSMNIAELFGMLRTEDRETFMRRLRDRLAGRDVPIHYNFMFQRPDGTSSWLDIYASRIEFGSQPAVLAILLDIGESKKSDLALTASQKRYRTLFEESHDAIFITSVEDRFLDANQAMLDLFGYSREEILKLPVSACYANPADRKMFQTAMKEHGSVRDYEAKLRRKDGTAIDCFLNSTLLRDDEGKIIGYQGIIRDITEKKRAEQALKESETQYRTTINSMGDAIHAVDQDLRIILFNDAFKKWNRELGLNDDVFGRDVFEVFPFLPPRVRDEYRHVLQNGEILITQETFRIGNREIITETRKIPVFEGSKVVRIITVMRDITTRYKAEEEFKENALKMRRILEETTYTLASTVEKRDPYTAGHQQRVARLANAIAQEMGLTEDQIDGIKMAALIHDIGKIYVPAEILNKPGRLTDMEYNLIKAHPQLSYDILKTIEFPWPVALTILQHHERANGSGYPSGLTAQAIIQEAKILAVADVVEAIYSNRPYRPARGIEKALEEITNNKEILYDPEVVDACIRLFDKKDFKFE
jgi:PAS domain S-box-containing protein/putative nucleotidyltransferase with HDIG domain